jgi:hypothetical protein
MDRWGWVAMRAYGPAALALLAAVVSMAVLWSWETSPLLAEVVAVARWVPLIVAVVASGLAVAATYRLVPWQRGTHVSCAKCGGPLGHERPGYARMGGAYRRCYACGDNVNHRRWDPDW